MSKSIQQIKNIFKDVSDGIRVVLLIHRSKDGGANNPKLRHLKKIITTNSEEFFETIQDLKLVKFEDGRALRIYASVNSCDMRKAIRMFKHRQLDKDFEEESHRNKFYLLVPRKPLPFRLWMNWSIAR